MFVQVFKFLIGFIDGVLWSSRPVIAWGWNMYQREWFQGKPPVSPKAYKSEVGKCSLQWAAEPPDVKESFENKAAYEQYLRDEAMKQPFESKKGVKDLGRAGFDAASELAPKALKKISQARVVETYSRYDKSELWSQSSMGLASADGCLRLDLIDSESRSREISKFLTEGMHAPPPQLEHNFEDSPPGCFDDTCWDVFGHCRKRAHVALAKKLVKSFKDFVASGILVANCIVNILSLNGFNHFCKLLALYSKIKIV